MEIEKQIDERTIERWRFTFLDGAIFLDGYCLLSRESRRKKPQIIKKYDRLATRGNSITELLVPLTDELKSEVLSRFVESIKVLKWSDR